MTTLIGFLIWAIGTIIYLKLKFSKFSLSFWIICLIIGSAFIEIGLKN